ncbi:hypothetical protein B0H17DRAFT_1180517 [Mycena rosella]|uniref:Xylanolytic transcriptional activator regulatory domain-containing protein n=1 Tax=Mycena rosella TaxID=1033263 RepID=A0AAD7DD90_MYCRO|nr:hypothetical protein B0H17DRAFT_1180517 [Mycena rosella]
MKVHLFYGKSSSVRFLDSAIKRIHGNTSVVLGVQRPEFWTTQPASRRSAPVYIAVNIIVFPDDDLLTSLVNLYFEQINPIIGILHSPTFRQSIAEGLHFRDQAFGAVLLAVCSVASRYSDDPRVLLEGVNSELSCGWKWFHQLSVLYLPGTWNPEECWILASLGLRFAQSAGAHHRSGYRRMKPLEAKLYKRGRIDPSGLHGDGKCTWVGWGRMPVTDIKIRNEPQPSGLPYYRAIKSPQILELSGIGRKEILENIGVECKVDLPLPDLD